MSARMPPLRFRVTGMRCAACARSIEREVGGLTGVGEAIVNLATAQLTIRPGTAPLDPGAVERAVAGLGYGLAPLCDAATGPAAGSPDEGQGELARLTMAGVLASVATVVALGWGHAPWAQGVGLAASLGILLVCGGPVFAGAARGLANREPNMDALVAIGAVATYGYAIWEVWSARHNADPLACSSPGLLLTFIQVGRTLEARLRARARHALASLLAREPATATLLSDDGIQAEVARADLKEGDRVVVRPGAMVPVDGVVREGRSALDEAMVTGESLPADRGPGDRVIGGTLNLSGRLVIEATVVGQNTLAQRIARLVEEGLASKAPIQRLADRVCAVFVPTVLGLSLATLLAWGLLLDAHAPAGTSSGAFALRSAAAVLVVACPCALGLATPVALVVAAGLALRQGLLVKRAGALEALGRVRMVVFDKTGTLTVGTPELRKVVAGAGLTDDQVLVLAASVATGSGHPLARAVLREAREWQLALDPVEDLEEIAGQGVRGRVREGRVLLGSRAFAAGAGVAVGPCEGQSGHSELVVALEGEEVGRLYLGDVSRDDAARVIAELRGLGVRTALLSGDRPEVAQELGASLGLDTAHGGLSPEAKLEHLARLSASAGPVAMVGDGINDGPALAVADVGIAMGSGSDLAKEVGDVVLVGGELSRLVRAIELGRRTLSTIRQNIAWASFYNLVAIPFAAGVAVPWGGPLVPPHFAGLAMGFSSLAVVANSLLMGMDPRWAAGGTKTRAGEAGTQAAPMLRAGHD